MGPLKTIGLPQGLFYWQHEVLWRTFFKELGIDLITSGPTTTRTVNLGVKNTEDESCFSYKVLFGHIIELFDKVDVIFLPSYISLSESHTSCPKFSGIGSVVKTLKLPKKLVILSPTIDLRKHSLLEELIGIGLELGKSKPDVCKAAKAAILGHEEKEIANGVKFSALMSCPGKKVLIFGHRYILEDDFVNFRIIDKLKKIGLVAVPVHFVPEEELDNEFGWDFVGEEIAKLKSLDRKELAGIIQLSSFNCGPDSIITEFLYGYSKHRSLPFLHLIFDEQTGEAGVMTRLEAFFDTVSILKNGL